MANRRTGPIEPEEEIAEALPRSGWKRLSSWEYLGLGILLLVIALFSVRPLYVWHLERRAAEMRKEIESLKGTTNPKDWDRLLELTTVTFGRDHPQWTAWLFEASQDRFGAIEVSVRGPAMSVLRDAVLQTSQTAITALTAKGQLGGWTGREIPQCHYNRDRNKPHMRSTSERGFASDTDEGRGEYRLARLDKGFVQAGVPWTAGPMSGGG